MTGTDSSTAQTSAPVRVAVVDDSYLIREGLRLILEGTDQLDLTGSYASVSEAQSAIVEDQPDVVLCDIRLPPSWTDEGVRFAELLRVESPQVAVVLMSQESSVRFAADLLSNGAQGRGYLLKDRIHDLDQLIEALTAVAAGECRVDPTLVARLVNDRSPDTPLSALTPRQVELLSDIAEGRSNQAIAIKRTLSLRAVEKHVSEIFLRLDIAGDAQVNRRVRATLLYLGAQ